VTASDQSTGFESTVGKALSPDSGCLVVAIGDDWGLLPGDGQLNVHGKSGPELVGWEGDVTAENVTGVGDGRQLYHSWHDIHTSSKHQAVEADILFTEAR
jgi:hypothetical protein